MNIFVTSSCPIESAKFLDTKKILRYILLQMQEEVGMLPPPDYTETYYSGDEPGGYNPNFWENEK